MNKQWSKTKHIDISSDESSHRLFRNGQSDSFIGVMSFYGKFSIDLRSDYRHSCICLHWKNYDFWIVPSFRHWTIQDKIFGRCCGTVTAKANWWKDPTSPACCCVGENAEKMPPFGRRSVERNHISPLHRAALWSECHTPAVTSFPTITQRNRAFISLSSSKSYIHPIDRVDLHPKGNGLFLSCAATSTMMNLHLELHTLNKWHFA